MAGIVLDAELHAIARYLVKLEKFVHEQYQGVVNIQEEIRQLNNEYAFVSQIDFGSFLQDTSNLYQYERQRSLSSISQVAFAKFKLDNLTGDNRIQQIKNELASELNAVRT